MEDGSRSKEKWVSSAPDNEGSQHIFVIEK